MQRRKFSREFKLGAVRLVKDRGVAVAQAARCLDVHEMSRAMSARAIDASAAYVSRPWADEAGVAGD
jgi:transposase